MPRNTLYNNQSACSQQIVITIDLPMDCRLNEEIIGERIKEIFNKELLRDLCTGCPLENPGSSSESR
ncbi:MAG TPA: hypothetical protein ENN25_03205 [Euryarchaeota archaeon]|nr:hypothetical protein [Euryarchaeota archaeon]